MKPFLKREDFEYIQHYFFWHYLFKIMKFKLSNGHEEFEVIKLWDFKCHENLSVSCFMFIKIDLYIKN